MTFLKKLGCAAALAVSAGFAHASPIMNDWVFNPSGTGFHKGQEIGEFLDVNGSAFIQLKAAGKGAFTFTEYAVFNLAQADGNGRLFAVNFPGGNISATLKAEGTGTFGGAFTFTGGTIKMYQNATNQYSTTAGIYGANLGNNIATFNVISGGGLVDGTGQPTKNGQVSIMAEAQPGMLKAGYFFNKNGIDLSTLLVEGFAFTNANPIGAPGKTLISEVACEFAGYKGNGCGKGTYKNVAGDHFFIANAGQFKLGDLNDIPEPGSVALFGIAMLGLATAGRRRQG